MTLRAELLTARTEEDVKDAYIKALGLRGVFKGLVDIQTEEVWFEAKEAPTPPLLMFAQLLTYVRAARKRGEAIPGFLCVIDREKAGAFGITFEDINSTISTNLGSAYVNDFPNQGRMQRVIVQSEAASRMNPDGILGYNVRNSLGQLVPFSSFATVEWAKGPTQIVGFNYYPSVRISGEAKPGYTSGDALAEMERLAGQLPRGFGYEWTGTALQEKAASGKTTMILGLAVLFAYLFLVALYESGGRRQDLLDLKRRLVGSAKDLRARLYLRLEVAPLEDELGSVEKAIGSLRENLSESPRHEAISAQTVASYPSAAFSIAGDASTPTSQ